MSILISEDGTLFHPSGNIKCRTSHDLFTIPVERFIILARFCRVRCSVLIFCVVQL